jgi:hypothetical protein
MDQEVGDHVADTRLSENQVVDQIGPLDEWSEEMIDGLKARQWVIDDGV